MLFSIIRANTYQDSLRLMQLSSTLDEIDGVCRASVMMGTDNNKDILRRAGLTTSDVEGAGPTDLVVVADLVDDSVRAALVAHIDRFLVTGPSIAHRTRLRSARSLEHALEIAENPNLALISIPGEYVAGEAHRLLDEDLHVFIFSDNVSIEHEVALKNHAARRGLLVMGPDCGTGLIGGLPLAFANAVHDGPIGIVGAAGTGIQEIMVQIDHLGSGISTAIGVGGRDLSAQVGGITFLQALRALAFDARTDVVVLVAKPPATVVRDEVLRVARTVSKPVVVMLLGEKPGNATDGNLHFAETLAQAAELAVALAGTRTGRQVRLAPEQQWIKGFYTGGSLAAEAAALLRDGLGLAASPTHDAGYLMKAGGHEVVDLGDDAYTRGRPHPMIDPSTRADNLAKALADPENAVLVFDVVLGYGSADNPAAAPARAVSAGLAALHAHGRDVAVVASVCGTDDDPQSRQAQVRMLREAGVDVLPSNASAVRRALAIVQGRRIGPVPSARFAVGPIRQLLVEPPRIINIGLRSFAEVLVERGADVVQCDWRPAAGGDRRLQSLLDGLSRHRTQ